MTRKVTGPVLLFLALSAAPSRVDADWLLTPFVGGNFGGASIDTQTNFGVSAAWMATGLVGFEFDLGVAPDFLDLGLDEDFTLIDDSSVSTFMGNVILSVPVGDAGMGVRPYAAFGVGAIRTSASSRFALIDSSDTEFGWNVGAGAMGFLSNMIGLRGDLRYFRSMRGDFTASPLTEEIDDFSFWRLSGGVTFRWGSNNNP